MNDYEVILEINEPVEAGLLKTELEKRNIPFSIKTNYDMAYNGIFQLEKGWGYLLAPPEYSNIIRSIYQDLREDKEN
ncbi:MAG: hypothetical protein ACOCQH_03120 [Halanaerobiales bacterium]